MSSDPPTPVAASPTHEREASLEEDAPKAILVRQALHAGEAVLDGTFDRLYPRSVRLPSRRFWTPVAVARRAAELFRALGARRILDVGAGPGKACLIGAAVAPELAFHGVEQRGGLVLVARELAMDLGLGNVEFSEGDALRAPWAGFDGLYLFNPFGENIHRVHERIDATVELSDARYGREVRLAEQRLREAPLRTVVVTYHGFGGRIPGSYELEAVEPLGSDFLRAWVKRRERATGHYVESDGGARFVDVDDAAPAPPRRSPA